MQAMVGRAVIRIDDDSPLYSIGDAARAVGRSAVTVRLWERQRRIEPARRDRRTGERVYSKSDIERLRAFVAREAAPVSEVSDDVRERLQRLRRWGARSRSAPLLPDPKREAELIT